MKQGKVRLIIDFKNKEGMLNWIEQIKAFQAMNSDAHPYEIDNINESKKSVNKENTYIMATKEDILLSSVSTKRH